MKILIIALGIFMALPAFAQRLPIVQAEQFKLGNFWVWDYFENGDRNRFYSSEKYTVIGVLQDQITFEITTKYAGKTKYTPSARFTARLNDCTQSFSGGRHRIFTIDMYSYSNGKWTTEPYQMRATAFEEKFNCNPIEYKANHPLYETIYDVATTKWGPSALFQQKPKVPNQILSYYFINRPLMAGIAFKKDFNANSPYEFEMELSDFFVQ